jgi:hypothetical protein
MSRLDKLKELHPELDKVSVMDIIASADPSTTYKYCDFLVKMFKRNFTHIENGQVLTSFISGQLFGNEFVETLNKFEDHHKAKRIRIKDISLYSTYDDIKDQVEEADEVVRIKELEKDANKIYNDSEWLVLIPKTYESAMLYANNTKWCITQKSYWNDYKKHTRIIFVINKKTDDKFAISKRFDDKVIQGWDARDIETSPLLWDFNDNIWKVLRKELKKSKIEIQLDELPSGMIFGKSNSIIPYEDATLQELEYFFKKFGDCLEEEFKNKIVTKGKELRELDEIEKRSVKKISSLSTKKTLGETDLYRWINNGDSDLNIDDLLKTYLTGKYYE